jgi:DNA-binding NarL/FixJ family response regulator
VRIFIAGSDSALRMSLQLLLESEAGMAVTGTSDQLEGLPAMVKASCPDVLLLAYELVNQGMAHLVGDLRCLSNPMKIIIFSTDPGLKEGILAAGADYFINMSFPPDELLATLREMR